MINNKVKLDKNPNLESIREFVNYFEKSYGKMSLIELEKVENDKVVSIGSYFTIDDMLAKVDNNTFSNAAFLNIYFAHSLKRQQFTYFIQL